MTEAEASFLRAVEEAIEGGDAEGLSSAVSDFSSFTFKEQTSETDPLKDDFLEELLRIIAERSFLKMEDSFKLLMFFQNDWGRLRVDQRRRVCRELERHFEDIDDYTSHLVISELLGEYLADETALQALDRLRDVPEPTPRAHVAHGYGALARSTQNELLKTRAVGALRRMTKDPSEIVVQEAANELSQLGVD